MAASVGLAGTASAGGGPNPIEFIQTGPVAAIQCDDRIGESTILTGTPGQLAKYYINQNGGRALAEWAKDEAAGGTAAAFIDQSCEIDAPN
jgi:hypothetical protein